MISMSYLFVEGKPRPYRVAFLGPNDRPSPGVEYPHLKSVSDTDYFSLGELKEKIPEMRTWCEQNATGEWYNVPGVLLFQFESEDDAMLFKMTWG